MCQEGHGVYDCCKVCGKYVKYDGMADADYVFHSKCQRPLGDTSPKSVGDDVTYSVAAPGIGSVTYRITSVDDTGCSWGILSKDASRILDPSEVI